MLSWPAIKKVLPIDSEMKSFIYLCDNLGYDYNQENYNQYIVSQRTDHRVCSL